MTRPAPSVRVDHKDSPPWLPWLLGLLLLAVLAAVLWFLFAGDDEDEALPAEDSISQGIDQDDAEEIEAGAETDTDTEVATDTETETGTTDEAAGPLVLTPPFAALAGEAGQPVTATSVQVVDVPADEAFTIGTDADELLVYITPEARAAGGGESAVNVEPGSVVTSLEGTLEPLTDEFIGTLALEGDEADAVREREFYVAATAFEVAAG